MHPAITIGEHADELLLQIAPVIVAPREQIGDGFAQDRVGLVNRPEGAAGCLTIENIRGLRNIQGAAEAGKERLLQGDFAAEGVDGGDAELRGEIEKIPAEG